MNDHELAAQLAEQAGLLLVKLRNNLIEEGASPNTIKSQGDASSHQFIAKELADLRPKDFVLSEEGQRSGFSDKERVWIIDPLDGTREYGEFPRDDWAVHIALVVAGKLEAGAVSLPARQKVFSTAAPPPAPSPSHTPLHIAVSRTRPGKAAQALQESLGAKMLPMGSAGVKTMAVIEGSADAYAHSGGQKEWDSAAPMAVARAVGLWTSDLSGAELIYNRPDPHVDNLLVCKPDAAESCLAALKQAGF